jgi:hypothetical protein
MFIQTWWWKHYKDFCQTPLYKIVKISIRQNWQDLMQLTNVSESVDLKGNVIDESI